ncbi:hypothetical protein BCV69DRAFT_272908 [Microstroma glucosiphilum]|uniref:Complex 1 LYR protein domain-containing protein n=1 Tax=Pseudomicrostroma glucosiphilum TaxID=1684307 RepID=A0A316U0Q2_9BASI|nr:hypothetical protein BCV69DRAFT_272908 [Pseudomicrostroma glucosiphilum]PWN18976.1 hypothetical protein BCV69DRAFT_272908 [Pseudomicrostroma glucosiphilum]
MPPKLTPAQKQVFTLYRRGLRAIRAKPEASQPSFLLYLRHAFRSPSGGGGLRKRDFGAIEYMLRRGDKMIGDVLEEKGTKSISLPRGASEWWEEEVRKARGGGGE